MLHKDLQKILESVGLSQRDAALYLTGLEIGNDAASAYAKKTELNRITCFPALDGFFTKLKTRKEKSHKRPIVRFFAGWEGVRHVYDDTLTAGSEILNFA